MSDDYFRRVVRACIEDDELCKLFVERCMNFEREVSAERHRNLSAERHRNLETMRYGYEFVPGTNLFYKASTDVDTECAGVFGRILRKMKGR